jgi:hypothetical protein
MLELRNRMAIAVMLCPWSLFLSGASNQESVRPQKPWEGIHLEFAGGRIELQNPLRRSAEEVEVAVIVCNRGKSIKIGLFSRSDRGFLDSP